LGTATPSLAQENGVAAPAPWRPAKGLYEMTVGNCKEFADLIIDLADKFVSGNEWSCDVTKLTDVAPGSIRVDMTCSDFNLAEKLDPKNPNSDTRRFKEFMYLKKIGEKSMSVRKTENGKLKYPAWRALYCSEDAQRDYTESNKQAEEAAKADAAERAKWEQKAAEER